MRTEQSGANGWASTVKWQRLLDGRSTGRNGDGGDRLPPSPLTAPVPVDASPLTLEDAKS